MITIGSQIVILIWIFCSFLMAIKNWTDAVTGGINFLKHAIYIIFSPFLLAGPFGAIIFTITSILLITLLK